MEDKLDIEKPGVKRFLIYLGFGLLLLALFFMGWRWGYATAVKELGEQALAACAECLRV